MPRKKTNTSQLIARAGYAARGVVFLIIGGFALLAGFDSGTRPTDTKGALQWVLSGPGGPVLLAVLAAGLACFGVWRLVQSLGDADHEGRTGFALVHRAVYGASAIFYFGLAAWAVLLLIGTASDSGTPQDWTASVMQWPLGRVLIAAVGVGFVVGGIGTAVRSCRPKFEQELRLGPDPRRWAVRLGRIGYFARGAVFVLIGIFLATAAAHANPREAAGLAGALRALQGEPYGGVLLVAAGCGLLAFAAFQFVLAAYRRIDAPPIGKEISKLAREAKPAGRTSAA